MGRYENNNNKKKKYCPLSKMAFLSKDLVKKKINNYVFILFLISVEPENICETYTIELFTGCYSSYFPFSLFFFSF